LLFLIQIINDLCARFDSGNVARIHRFYCIPSMMASKGAVWKEKVRSFVKENSSDMPDLISLNAELDRWGNLWLKDFSGKLPSTVDETLTKMTVSMYPNIFTILHLLAVLPVTTCSCERSISSLRRVKTYLRSTMTQVSRQNCF